MSAEEPIERLAKAMHEGWSVEPCDDCRRLAAKAADWFANEAAPGDLSLLLAGRPIEERLVAEFGETWLNPVCIRAYADNFEMVARYCDRMNDPTTAMVLRGRASDMRVMADDFQRVAIPEEETL